MDDLNEKIEETVESVIDVFIWTIGFLFLIVLLVMLPVWIVPYLIIRKIKRARE